jgi:flagellar basal-body rod protein FlgF
MNVGLYQAAAAMNANARWQEMISGNLAAGSVPGFKKQEMSFSAIQAGLMPHGDVRHAGAPMPFALPIANGFTNFSGGELKATGINTNVALEGAGFFSVQLPNGGTALTRDGEFQLNAQGQLATKQGYLVLGENGPIQFDVNNGAPISISPTGEVSQGADVKGTLKIAAFQNPDQLSPLGSGLFDDRNSALRPITGPKPTVRQGWIEGANTSATAEMANLITAMRSFEANQRVVQLHDERMGKLISELGNPN